MEKEGRESESYRARDIGIGNYFFGSYGRSAFSSSPLVKISEEQGL